MTLEQRVDRGRIAGDRVQHLMAARLDLAGEHDFAFAREQRHRVHAPHVERERIGRRARAAREVAEHGPAFVERVAVDLDRRRAGERRGHGRLVEYRDADVGQRGAHDIERVGAVAFGRQRVDEVGVRQITLLAGERQQLDDRIERCVRPGSGAWRSHVDGGASRVPVWGGPKLAGLRLPVGRGRPSAPVSRHRSS